MTRARQLWAPILLTLVAVNAAYLIAVDDPTILRVGSGLAHLPLGLVAAVLLIYVSARGWSRRSSLARTSALLTILGLVSGLMLVAFGNLAAQRPILLVHGFVASAGVVVALVWILKRSSVSTHRVVAQTAFVVTLSAGILGSAVYMLYEPAQDAVANAVLPPSSMEEEAFGGPDGMFFPSSAYTQDADTIPGTFFSRSEGCGRSGCHPDAVQQWNSSAHRFSSFNNQWYRKSIEYMQEIKGTEAAKWCAGCHDHALLFSGQMQQPVADLLDLPEAHVGTGCMSCHSVRSVKGTMGNGGLEIAFPLLHEIATSDNRFVQVLHDFALRIDPEPHRRAFLKPFHTEQTSEFCSSCHKVHLDRPVNNYRWVRGFNTYDNWQASGVSGQGARSFYEPQVPQDCAACHMPAVASDDAGNDSGFMRDHRFLAANTALPVANEDEAQLQSTIEFLQAGRLRVDVFAVTSSREQDAAADLSVRESAQTTTFAEGEESGFSIGAGGVSGQISPLVAPLKSGMTAVRPGTSVRLDVVVRSLSVGHFFPTGTVDAQEAWLEVKVLDDNDQVVFWSGQASDGGAGPVDESAHFYRSLLVDANSNRINKRNAWAARSTVYVNLIPPGAADVAHYRLSIPESGTSSLRVVAMLQYRKFDWWHNRFAYAGQVEPADTAAAYTQDFDDREWVPTGSTDGVSGKLKEIPVLPIVTMASDTLRLSIGPALDVAEMAEEFEDRERWNDYGIALMLEGDLRGAERAFSSVTRIDSSYADGWVNLARVYLREGDLEAAEEVLDRADAVRPDFYKARFFRALAAKALGNYREAIEGLQAVAIQFPNDRVVQGELGRVYFLDGELELAASSFERVLMIDPEDLGAHYNMMLIMRALGDVERAVEHEVRYQRFKADENAMAISRKYRQEHPHDNNEALAVHEHRDGRSTTSATP